MLLHHFLEKSAERSPHKEALVCNDKRLTFSEIETYANRLANALIIAGLQKLDRVAVYLDNSVESVISIFGILKAGGIFVVINPLVKARKLEYILNDCLVKFLITDSKLLVNCVNDFSSLDLILLTKENPPWQGKKIKTLSFWDFIQESEGDLPFCESIDTDLCSLIYTSGSTGNPKGVMLTHLNIVSAANSIIQYLENTVEDIIVNFLPLSFDYGLYNILMPFKFGGTVILEKSFLYPYQLIGLVNKEKATGLPLVPTIIACLLKFKNLDKYNLPTLRYITSTGQALPPAYILQLSELFPKVKIYSMYGLTECKRVSYLPPNDLLRKPNSVGKPMPNIEAYIVNQNGERITKPGEVGELLVRGANVMKGYWNLPTETAKVLQIDPADPSKKVLRTGDLFKFDEEEYLYFVARKDNLIKTGGELVSPKEIENVLYELKEVKEVIVYAVQNETLGYTIKASVVLEENSKLTEKALIEHCSLYLEKYMIPKCIEICQGLPKTLTGKISHPPEIS